MVGGSEKRSCVGSYQYRMEKKNKNELLSRLSSFDVWRNASGTTHRPTVFSILKTMRESGMSTRRMIDPSSFIREKCSLR